MDFAQLAQISRQAGLAGREEQSWRFGIPEQNGSLVALLESLPKGVNITELQYGRTDSAEQHPILRLEAPHQEGAVFEGWLQTHSLLATDVSHAPQTRHRVIPFSPELFHAPWFVEVEFRERAGALLSFMKEVSDVASLCYFNYSYSGERVGRALLGLDFTSPQQREEAKAVLRQLEGKVLRSLREVLDLP